MPKANLKTRAYNIIREKIANCEYPPGMFLNEAILTDQLQLGRTPVRDAISRLEQEGLVEIKSKKGIIVSPLSVNMINNIFEIRLLCEPYILSTYGRMIPQSSLEEFYALLVKKESAERFINDRDYFYKLDSEFHELLISPCQNIYLRQSYAMLWTQNERFRHMTGEETPNRLLDTITEHLNIIKPCLSENWSEAADQLSYHLEQSRKASFKLIFDSSDDNYQNFMNIV